MGKLNITRMFALFILITLVFQPNFIKAADLGEGDQYLAFAEQMPEPVGGLQEIYAKIKYPEIAKKAGVQGKVFIMAMINENGTVDDVKVIKGIGGGCDEAASAAVKSSKFTSAKNKGQAVKVKLSLSIEFKLS
ncbi:MAG: energy transducer TonB [Melioribacteraceae bacterium]|nr:energy transducer TonB [Ignavibacteriota bacterium]MBZ0181009.1 energy transducer TonB [Melioribacteraceae bacterium]